MITRRNRIITGVITASGMAGGGLAVQALFYLADTEWLNAVAAFYLAFFAVAVVVKLDGIDA